MIEIWWREEIPGLQHTLKASEFKYVEIHNNTATSTINAFGEHSKRPRERLTVARMKGAPPEEVEHYKRVLADLIQVRYGIKDVEIT